MRRQQTSRESEIPAARAWNLKLRAYSFWKLASLDFLPRNRYNDIWIVPYRPRWRIATVPVSIKIDPFSRQPIRKGAPLRTPQARVLAALVPEREDDPKWEWPLVTRAQLSVRAGYTAVSGTVTRALNGIRAGSSSGDPHPGLLVLGLVEEVSVNIDGVLETNYRATVDGIHAYQAHLASQGGELPRLREAADCINDRYRKEA